jgi:hypothetical protein
MEGVYPETPSNRFGNTKWTRKDDKPFGSQLQKTRDFNRSTHINIYTPTERAVSNLEVARRTIDEVIGRLGDKRDMNE